MPNENVYATLYLSEKNITDILYYLPLDNKDTNELRKYLQFAGKNIFNW